MIKFGPLNLTLINQLNDPKCIEKCGKHTWQEVFFENSPIWLVYELCEDGPKVL